MLTSELRIDFNKKPGKLAQVKVVKDPAVPRDDVYKSGTIRTAPGEPANSVSKPTPRPKQVAGKPISKGKLLRPGGPGGGPSKLSQAAAKPRPRPAPQQLPGSGQQSTLESRPVPQPAAVAAAVATSNHNRVSSTASQSQSRPPPPPPPPAPQAAPPPKKPMAKVLYDFNSGNTNELAIRQGELVQIISRETNGIPSFLTYPIIQV